MSRLSLSELWRLLMLISVSFSCANLSATTIHRETNGLVAIELEDTDSPLGLWKLKRTKLGNDFSGDGYLEFTGNSPISGEPKSPLEYTFTINKEGLYYLHLRCAKEVLTIKGKKRTDVANDCYFRVEGDFGAGPNAGDKHGKDAPLALLKSDTKFFGGANNKFEWASGNRLDPGGHNNKRVAVYKFKAGETYQLIVSGRSQFFKVDCLAFRHADVSVAAVESVTARTKGVGPLDPNRFNKEKDLFIAQFDSLPDSDDIHSQAAVGCLLAHPHFRGVNYFAVAGAYGVQVKNAGFKYIDSSELFDLAFGTEALATDSAEQRAQSRWVNAHGRIIYGMKGGGHVERSPERITQMDFASEVVKDKAKPILEKGGRVFVMEAGQSDFTADWMAKLIAEGVSNTSTNVILVQHSVWNEKHTAGHGELLYDDGKDDWDYINDSSILRYVQIDDGNHDYGSKPMRRAMTPNYKNTDTQYLIEAIDAKNPNAHARELWTLAKEIVAGSSYKGKVMVNGGVDFSDTVEAMWIFDLASESARLTNVRDFWDAYVVNAQLKPEH